MENLTKEQKIEILKANRDKIIDSMFDEIDRTFTWVKPTLSQKQQHMGKFMSLIVEFWDGTDLDAPFFIPSRAFFLSGNAFRNLCDECFASTKNKSDDMQYAQNEIAERKNNILKFQSL
jgi:hypothetical protein